MGLAVDVADCMMAGWAPTSHQAVAGMMAAARRAAQRPASDGDGAGIMTC
jgi:hypothetical protein